VTEGDAPQPTDEELMSRLEEELKKLKVSDLLVQTLYTVSSLGYRKLSDEDRDLEQARLAIEALRALLPVLEGAVAEELVRDFKQVTSNLQLAYADAAKGKNGGG
jgi:predicted nucleic acid-binding protein